MPLANAFNARSVLTAHGVRAGFHRRKHLDEAAECPSWTVRTMGISTTRRQSSAVNIRECSRTQHNPVTYLDSTSMCRLCLTNDSVQYVSLHDKHDDVPIAKIISTCFGIEICRNDGLVQTICSVCWNAVLKYNELRERCLASDKILREAQRKKCPTENESAEEQLSKESSEIYSAKHQQQEIMIPTNDLPSINNEDLVTNHFVLSELVRNDPNTAELADSPVHTAPPNQVNSSEIDQEKQPVKLFCCGCNPSLEFTSPEELNVHCDVAHKKYRISDNSIRPFECSLCFQRFLTETLLKQHKERPYRKRSYICGSCSAAYFTNSALKRHEKLCTVVDKNYTCEDCGKRFRQIVTLKNHRKLHQTAKTFSCPVCLKTFKQKFEIPIHMTTHTGEQPYPCDQCPARFKRMQALKIHQHRHVNPRPFKCESCGESFSNPTSRKFHRQTVHEGLDPFRCDQCGLSYGRMVRLKQHVKKVHGEAV
uniref:Protein krueppel n=1 Tax=Anopheles culicifacies TaxID=139723 RepID=A0A182LZY4_9DIPT